MASYDHYGQRAARIRQILQNWQGGESTSGCTQKSLGISKPNKQSRSDSEVFWSWPVMTITASVQAGSYMLDPTSHTQIPIQFHFFQRRPESYCAKLIWIQIQSGWPGQVLGKGILSVSKQVCKNHHFLQNATGLLPVSHFQTQLHSSTVQTAQIILSKTSPDHTE